MRERVTSLGGEFSVTSGNGTGTQVRAILPLAAEGEHGE
jgi:signal transduction histidine kinase